MVNYQSKPGEDEIEQLIDHFDVYPELAEECMSGAVDVVEVERDMVVSERNPSSANTRRSIGCWHL